MLRPLNGYELTGDDAKVDAIWMRLADESGFSERDLADRLRHTIRPISPDET